MTIKITEEEKAILLESLEERYNHLNSCAEQCIGYPAEAFWRGKAKEVEVLYTTLRKG